MMNAGLIWSFVSAMSRLGGSVLIIPFAAAILPRSSLGTWYVFVSIGALIGRIDFGVAPTVSRAFAYLLSGRCPTGLDRRQSVRSFVYSVMLYYGALTAVAVLIIAGVWLWLPAVRTTATVQASCAFGASVLLQLGVGGTAALLTGANLIDQPQKASMCGSLVGTATAIVGLYADFGLLALAIGQLLTAVIAVVGNVLYLRKLLQNHASPGRAPIRIAWVQQIWPGAWRTGMMSVGAYLAYYANTVWAAKYLGMEEAASYGMTFQIFQFGLGLSCLPVAAALPELATRWARMDSIGAWRLFYMRHAASVLCYSLVALGVILVGSHVFTMIGSKTPLLPQGLLILFCITFLLELNHTNYASFVLSSDTVPFVLPAVLSGVAIAAAASWTVSRFGAVGLIGTTMVVQGMWNNWGIPLYAYRKLPRHRNVRRDFTHAL